MLNECRPGHTVCKCCGNPYTMDNPMSQSNPSMCVDCTYQSVFSVRPSELHSTPKGRWTEKQTVALESQQAIYDAMMKEIKK